MAKQREPKASDGAQAYFRQSEMDAVDTSASDDDIGAGNVEESLANQYAGATKMPKLREPKPSDGAAEYFRQKDLKPKEQSPVDDIIDQDIAYAKAQLAEQEKYDSQNLKAAAAGFARGAIPGFDLIATKALGIDPEELSKLKEFNPTLSGGSEAVGFLSTALTPAAPGKMLLGGAVMAAEKTIAKHFIGKKIAQRVIGTGVAGGVTGGALGLNQLLNEHALGETDLNGENLIAYVGTGAALNGLVSGAFGAGSALYKPLKTGVDATTGQARKLFKREIDPLRAIAELSNELPAGKINAYDDLVKIGRSVEESTELVQKYANERWKINPINEDVESMLAKNSRAGSQIKQELAGTYAAVDKLTPSITNAQEVLGVHANALSKFKQQNLDLFDSKTAKNTLRSIEQEVLNRAGRKGTDSATSLWDLAKTYGKKGKLAFNDPVDGPLKAKLYAQLYADTRELLVNNIERVTAGTALEGISGKIAKLNQEYRINKVLQDGLSRRGSTGSFVNFKDAMLTLATGAAAGPVGAAGALLSKKLLDSDVRRRIVVLGTTKKAIDRFEKRMTGSFDAFFAGKKLSPTVSKAARLALVNSGLSMDSKRRQASNEQEAFKNIRETVAQLSANPDKLATKIAGNLMQVDSIAPNMAASARDTLSRGFQFLASKIPRDPRSGTNMFGDDEFEPSSLELAQFKRYVQAVENPYSVLDDLNEGTLTREHVEALRAVYPSIYSQLQQKALVYVSQRPKLDYSRKIQIGVLLDIPVDASLAPSHVAMLQGQFAAQGQTPAQMNQASAVKPSAKGLSELGGAERSETPMQSAGAGIQD